MGDSLDIRAMEGEKVSRCQLTCICNWIFFLISLLCGPHLRVVWIYLLCKSVLPSAYKLKVTASCRLAWSSGGGCATVVVIGVGSEDWSCQKKSLSKCSYILFSSSCVLLGHLLHGMGQGEVTAELPIWKIQEKKNPVWAVRLNFNNMSIGNVLK